MQPSPKLCILLHLHTMHNPPHTLPFPLFFTRPQHNPCLIPKASYGFRIAMGATSLPPSSSHCRGALRLPHPPQYIAGGPCTSPVLPPSHCRCSLLFCHDNGAHPCSTPSPCSAHPEEGSGGARTSSAGKMSRQTNSARTTWVRPSSPALCAG